jgi:hypothetical protein
MQEAQGEGGQGGTLRACLPATYRYSHCSSALNCTQQVLLPLYIIFPAGRTDSIARPVSSLSPPPLVAAGLRLENESSRIEPWPIGPPGKFMGMWNSFAMIARVSHGFARGVFISVSGPAGLRRPAMLGSLSLPCLPWLPEPTTAGRVTARDK